MGGAYLIGTDEAGYGPNLGPLVISATVWEVPDGVGGEDLYRLLGPCVAPLPGRAADDGPAPVAFGDSKRLYKPGGGLRHLERGLLAALRLLDRRPTTWQQAWEALGTDSTDSRQSIPWYADYDVPIPLDADARETEPLAQSLAQRLASAGVRLVEIRSKALFPEEFNRLVDNYGTKGAALSHTTLGLVAALVEPLRDRPISITCDKHGGRNRYGRLLAEHFPEWLVEIYGESRAQSVYRFGPQERRVEFRFQKKAESQLPTALASMASKYLRELAMRALNAFWQRRVPGLRPTAGYPQDAKRFKADVAAALAELGIDDRRLWRMR
jgi:ribonuclease HII